MGYVHSQKQAAYNNFRKHVDFEPASVFMSLWLFGPRLFLRRLGSTWRDDAYP